MLAGPGLGSKELGGYPGLLLDLDAWVPEKNVASLTCLHSTSSKAAPQRMGAIEDLGIKLDQASRRAEEM